MTNGREKELFEAIDQGDHVRLKALLAAGVNPNARREINFESWENTRKTCATALMLAVRRGYLKTVELLLAAKADINAPDNWERHIWAYAVGYDTTRLLLFEHTQEQMNIRLQLIRMLLRAGAKLDLKDTNSYPDYWGETALFHAAAAGVLTGDLRILKMLIAAGATVKNHNIIAFVTSTALSEMRSERRAPGASEVIRILINAGANLNGHSGNGMTALMLEAYWWELEGSVERVKVLLAAGADARAQNARTGETALLIILKHHAYYGDKELTAQQRAAARAKAEIVKLLVAAGADPNKGDNEGNTPLPASFDECWIAKFPSESDAILQALIAARVDLNSKDRYGRTLLSLAAWSYDCYPLQQGTSLRLVKTLIAAGADVNAQDKENNTALFGPISRFLVIRGEMIRTLIAAGTNVNLANIKGETPLMAAIVHIRTYGPDQESVDLLRLLLAAKANVNAKNQDGDTPLMLAVRAGREAAIIKTLITAGANVNAANNSGNTPLIIAADMTREEAIFKTLLAAGANVNATNNSGDTALIVAAKKYYPRPTTDSGETDLSAVNALIAAGADVRILNHEGDSALTIMAAKSRPDSLPFIRALIAAGRRERALDYPRTADLLIAIKRAAGRSSSEIVQELIAAGADVNATDESGKPLLIVAVSESGNAAVVRALLAARARVDARDQNGDTALIAAVREYLPGGNEPVRNALRRDPAVIRALLDYKADTKARDKDGQTALALAEKSGNRNLIDLLK